MASARSYRTGSANPSRGERGAGAAISLDCVRCGIPRVGAAPESSAGDSGSATVPCGGGGGRGGGFLVVETLEVTIEKLVNGGEGLARLPADAAGRREVVFVPFTLPGERVRIEREGRRVRLLEILEPSPERIAPGCEYFGRCGGCQLQHTSAAQQLALKRAILLETLQRTGGVVWEGEVQEHAAEPWGYRNRVRLQAQPGVGTGYYEAASHRVLAITHCPIASEAINQGIAELAAADVSGRAELELAVDNQDGGLHDDAPLSFAVAGRSYRVSPGAFFQVNRYLAEVIVTAVTAGEQGEAALDLFSGVGLFALPLTAAFARVEAVEANPVAAKDLRHNLATTRTAGVTIAAMPALAYLRRRTPEPVDLLVADPPRAGLGPELTAAIVALAPVHLHLVSCDPATLGRDLRQLLSAGYRIMEMHLLDLFPQTAHIETAVKLHRET
ncbi:MAG: class I SAM-dependent RNA methyltransferase [Acidobacteria bacterium]|nr:MAG: class I SAM-dependent RNA methyltransferase [Acidobacteriota bacterium]